MSAYGEGAPTYDNAELQRATLTGRLNVARGIRDGYVASGDTVRAARWTEVVDELLDRLNEVRGR